MRRKFASTQADSAPIDVHRSEDRCRQSGLKSSSTFSHGAPSAPPFFGPTFLTTQRQRQLDALNIET